MKHSTRPPKRDDVERFRRLREIGCLACYIDWITERATTPKAFRQACGTVEIHHQLSGNRRIGHEATVPLGRWHHQGIPLEGASSKTMTLLYGPSLAKQSKRFHDRYGDDDQLLDLANALLLRK